MPLILALLRVSKRLLRTALVKQRDREHYDRLKAAGRFH
jgi:hypothetical protein